MTTARAQPFQVLPLSGRLFEQANPDPLYGCDDCAKTVLISDRRIRRRRDTVFLQPQHNLDVRRFEGGVIGFGTTTAETNDIHARRHRQARA